MVLLLVSWGSSIVGISQTLEHFVLRDFHLRLLKNVGGWLLMVVRVRGGLWLWGDRSAHIHFHVRARRKGDEERLTYGDANEYQMSDRKCHALDRTLSHRGFT